MSLVINTNIASLQAQNNLTSSQSSLAQATERLSSGLKINSAADNAAGYAISTSFTTQIGALGQASSNASDAISMAQTASSALEQVTANLQAIRDLAVQSANGNYTSTNRQQLDAEVQQRLQEVTRIANQTTFNGVNVLNGSAGTLSFQIGADVGQTISVDMGSGVKASDLGQIATSSSADLSGLFTKTAATPAGLTLGAGDLTIDGKDVTGTFTDADDLATAINAAYVAAGNTGDIAAADGGEITITNADPDNDITVGGSKAGDLGLSSVDVGDDPVTSTGVADAVGAEAVDATDGTLTLAAGDLNIDGTDITGTFSSVQDLADAINAASYKDSSGALSVSAAVSADGKSLNLYSSSALTIYGTAADANAGDDVAKALKFSGAAGTKADATAIATSGNLSTGDVLSVDDANKLISQIDVALDSVSTIASNLGAVQNRFQSTISTLSAQTTNLQSSQSSIQDADFAQETANLSKAQVLQQAGISVLAQANSQPQQVLKLLQ